MLPPDPIDDELAYHREQIKQQRLAQGDSPTAADAYARRRLGNSLRIQEDVRSVHPLSALDTLFRHVRFAGRSFLRHGGAYLLATAILALGIGLSVAMFSLVEAVVFAPLPYPQQKNIHLVWKYDTQTATHVVGELAYPERLISAPIPTKSLRSRSFPPPSAATAASSKPVPTIRSKSNPAPRPRTCFKS